MKPYLAKLIISLLLISFLVPSLAEGVTIENPLKAKNFADLIDALINFIFVLAVGISPIMIIVAGFFFITAAGEPAKIEIAKKIILYTLIGLLIVFSAKGIIILFAKIFGTPTPYNP